MKIEMTKEKRAALMRLPAAQRRAVAEVLGDESIA